MITYLAGSAVEPATPGNKIIAHVCNDIGGWGRGFVLSLSAKWPEAERSYRQWFKESKDAEHWPAFSLGSVVFVPVQRELLPSNCCMMVAGPTDRTYCNKQASSWYRHNNDIYSFCDEHPHVCGEPVTANDLQTTWVANMIAQHDTKTINGIAPIRYDVLEDCLSQVRDMAREQRATVHMPRIGCGLAGGEWSRSRVEKLIESSMVDIDVSVYDFTPVDPRASTPWKR